MIVKYDEDNFSIKLYRDFVKGKLVGLMEVIPIDELLEVWEKHKAEQTEPQIVEQAKADLEKRSSWSKTYEAMCKTENCSEIPNNSTISKMEQVEEPYIDIETGILHWCGWKYRRIYEDEPQTDDAYFLELMGAVERGEISDAGANQAWYEYINHKDEPQTERSE